MANSENFKPVGQFSIDPNECMGLRMCVRAGRGVNLKVSKVGERDHKTSVTGQPKTPEEQILMIEGLGICPFAAGTIDGNSTHPAFREQARASLADPTYVDRAYAAIESARAKAKRAP